MWRQGAAASPGFPGDVGIRVSVDRCQDTVTYVSVFGDTQSWWVEFGRCGWFLEGKKKAKREKTTDRGTQQ